MKEVGAYDAKTHLSELLDDVSKGATITISRHGTPIALLVPFISDRNVPPQTAIARVKRLRKNVRLDGISLRDLIEEGRR